MSDIDQHPLRTFPIFHQARPQRHVTGTASLPTTARSITSMSAELVYTTFPCGAEYLLQRRNTRGKLRAACRLVYCNLNRDVSNALHKGAPGEAKRLVTREQLTEELIKLYDQRRDKMLQRLQLRRTADHHRSLRASSCTATVSPSLVACPMPQSTLEVVTGEEQTLVRE